MSRRWLKPNLNLVSNFTPLGLWRLKILFEDGRMNFNIFFLKMEKLLEFLILLSRLFHSVAMDGKYEFLKKVCLTCNWGISSVFLVLYVLLTLGILLTRYLGDLVLVSFKNSKVSYAITVVVRISNLILDNVFSNRNLW